MLCSACLLTSERIWLPALLRERPAAASAATRAAWIDQWLDRTGYEQPRRNGATI
jgi:hypothetical protein